MVADGTAAAGAASDGTAAGAAPNGWPNTLVLAAGGIVWRRRPGGELEVVVVHRPRYDDWSWPKGKLDPGETDEEAALREVLEETTLVTELGPELPSTTYLDRSGKHKRVRYWAMTVRSGTPTAANEVDKAVWLSAADAASRLTYSRDIELLDVLPTTIGRDGH